MHDPGNVVREKSAERRRAAGIEVFSKYVPKENGLENRAPCSPRRIQALSEELPRNPRARSNRDPGFQERRSRANDLARAGKGAADDATVHANLRQIERLQRIEIRRIATLVVRERIGNVEPVFPGVDRGPALHRTANSDRSALFTYVLPNGPAPEGRRVLSEVLYAVPLVVHPTMQGRPRNPGRKLARVDRDRRELVRLFQETVDVRECALIAVAIDEA